MRRRKRGLFGRRGGPGKGRVAPVHAEHRSYGMSEWGHKTGKPRREERGYRGRRGERKRPPKTQGGKRRKGPTARKAKRKRRFRRFLRSLALVLALCLVCWCFEEGWLPEIRLPAWEHQGIRLPKGRQEGADGLLLSEIPDYSGESYVELCGNVPSFTDEDLTEVSFEEYSTLDSLGRCGVAYANVGQDLMPTQERGSIRAVRPTGWHSVQYDFVDGGSLYNRCHLIGYQLTAENANEKNLITGTRYLNTEGMLPFENEIAQYVHETDGHVLYRVTPVYEGDDLVARGVQMEAYSVEDQGKSVCFNVFVYNVQPGVEIDYATGDSWLAG